MRCSVVQHLSPLAATHLLGLFCPVDDQARADASLLPFCPTEIKVLILAFVL
jgi:hypothetical protein